MPFGYILAQVTKGELQPADCQHNGQKIFLTPPTGKPWSGLLVLSCGGGNKYILMFYTCKFTAYACLSMLKAPKSGAHNNTLAMQ